MQILFHAGEREQKVKKYFFLIRSQKIVCSGVQLLYVPQHPTLQPRQSDDHPPRTACPKINAHDSLNESAWEQPFLSTEIKEIDSTFDLKMSITRCYEHIPEPKKPLHWVNISMRDFTESFFLLPSKGHGEPNLSPKTWQINRGSSLHTLHPRQETGTAHLPLAVCLLSQHL